MDVMEECYKAAAQARKLVRKLVLLFSEHPEDLGRVYREEDNLQLDPASIWQSESVRNLLQLDLDLFTVGFNQCCFGAPYKKPTRIISNIPGLQSWGFSGWPLFDEANTYLWPIRACGCQVRITLAKRGNSEGFRTAGTSAYPAQMDESLAQAVVMALKSMLSSPSEGGRQESIDGGKPGLSENPGKCAKTAKTGSGAYGASEVMVSRVGSRAAEAPEVAVSQVMVSRVGSRAAEAPEVAVSHVVRSSGVRETLEGSVYGRFQAQALHRRLRDRERFFPRTEGRGRSRPGHLKRLTWDRSGEGLCLPITRESIGWCTTEGVCALPGDGQ